MNIWQTKYWKELILKSNQASKVFEIDNVFVEKRNLWLWQFWLFVLGLEIDKFSSENLENIWTNLIHLCKHEKCLFVQIETFEIPLSQPFPPREKGVLVSPLPLGEGLGVREWHYKKFITPYTAIIDLSKTEEEILSLMKQKWRYNINLARKKWVRVFEAEKSIENIKVFHELMIETTSRDGFSWNNLEYYKNFLEIIPWSSLIFTKYEDKVLSAWIFVFDKNISIYYYWASTSDKEYRNLMAPYLMQDFAIKKAKSIDSKYYDFLWVATPWDENSSLAWVTDFKLKFTSDVREVSKSYIFVNQKLKYNIFKILKKIKSKF